MGARAGLTDDVREVRYALGDAWKLCDALGLLDGPRSYQRQARGLLVRCPWHDERTPSCSVYRGDDGTIAVRCHGCGASGDALSLVAIVSGLDARRDFREVLEEGARIAGIRLASLDGSSSSAPRPVRAPRPPAPRDDGPAPLGDDAFAELADALLELCPVAGEPDVHAYLEGRGIAGWAMQWGALPGDRARLGEVRDLLVERVGRDAWLRSGLAHTTDTTRGTSKAGDWMFAEHRLVIPWRAPGVSGEVQTFQRRPIRATRDGEPKYVATTGRPIRHPYGCEDALEELGDGVELAIVEGAIDTLAMRELVRRHRRPRAVVGIPGVEHWAKHLATLGELARGRVVVIALDADAAGERHVAELAKALLGKGAARIDRVRPTTGKDWADLTGKRASQP